MLSFSMSYVLSGLRIYQIWSLNEVVTVIAVMMMMNLDLNKVIQNPPYL